jgi:ribonuclease BN (tRNA processing enzyme)
MKLTVAGCGDAFGSGGRLQTCYHVDAGSTRFLIDCGATSLIGLARAGIDPSGVDTIFISHLHGDHFAGLVWWLLHAQHVARRARELVVVGPPGIEARFVAATEALFPGASKAPRRFALTFREMRAGEPIAVGDVTASAVEVSHPSGAPSHALRLAVGGRVIGFSGDTEWVEGLCEIARDADLFITECYAYDRDLRYHLTWKVLGPRLGDLGARRVLVTHMSGEMLARRHEITDPRVVVAEDGLALEV